MARALTAKNMYDQSFKTFALPSPYVEVLGTPTIGGCWLIFGPEKNGKSWAGLLISDLLRSFTKTLYISAEEGTDMDFVNAMQRAKIPVNAPGLNFLPYQTLPEIRKRLDNKRIAPGVIFLDNATVYADVIKPKDFQKLLVDYPNVLFILIAHEERNEPYTALAKYCKKMAKRIIRVRGLACEISGRGPGGVLLIDEEKAKLYHGDQILKAV